MPINDDELNEIKKLLEDESSELSPFSGQSNPTQTVLGKSESGASSEHQIFSPAKSSSDFFAEWETPETAKPKQTPGVPQSKQSPYSPAVRKPSGVPQTKRAPGTPAVKQAPGVPQTKRTPGTPAVRQTPGVPQSKQTPGTPAVKQTPGVPQTKQSPGAPAAPQRRHPPAQAKASALPDVPEKVRSYDATKEGKITNEPDSEPELDIGSKKFKMKFDFESAYKDVPEERPMRLRREKRTGCIGGILYGAFVICISLILATLLWMAAVDVLGFGKKNELVNVTVPTNFTIEDVTEMLYDTGMIKYKFLFNMYADFSKAEEKITAGAYVLNRNYDYRGIVQGMTARRGKRVETTVTIPEGYTLTQIFTLLEDYGVCPASKLWETATNYDFKYSFLDKSTLGDRLRLEGYLFPETHNFYLDSDPVQVLSKLLGEFKNRFTEDYIERVEEMDYSVHEIIIIASMIEREAGNDEERPRIAAVIYNRLGSSSFPKLQIDATINYAIAGTSRPFSTDIDDPYNTYLHNGLPPGPISNPGIESIRAALYPNSTKEFYYALNKQGTHNFFATKAQQDAFVNSSEYGGR